LPSIRQNPAEQTGFLIKIRNRPLNRFPLGRKFLFKNIYAEIVEMKFHLRKLHVAWNKSEACDAFSSSPFYLREASPFFPRHFARKACKNRPRSLFTKTLRDGSHRLRSFIITGPNRSSIRLRKSIPGSIQNSRVRPRSRKSAPVRSLK